MADVEKQIEEELKTNNELKEVFEKDPKKKDLYKEKIKDSEGGGGGYEISCKWCKSCIFSHGQPPFADMPKKAYCIIFNREETSGKPSDVYYEGAECDFYEKELE